MSADLVFNPYQRIYEGCLSDGRLVRVTEEALEDAIQDELANEGLYHDGQPEKAGREAYWREIYSDPDEWADRIGTERGVTQLVEENSHAARRAPARSAREEERR